MEVEVEFFFSRTIYQIKLFGLLSKNTNLVKQHTGTPTKRARISGVSYSTGCLGAISYSPCCCCMVGLTMTGDLRMFKLHHLSGLFVF